MRKWTVYAIVTASKVLGIYEADTEEEAIAKAEEDEKADAYFSICWSCDDKIDIGDAYEYQASEES